MSTNQQNSSVENIAGPVLVLFAVLALVLGLTLSSNQRINSAASESTTAATEEVAQGVETAQPTEVAAVEPTPTEAAVEQARPTLASLDVAMASQYDEATVATGRAQYLINCSACHGPDGRGIIGLGKNLIESEFVHGQNDEDLLAFIIVGRQPWDEGNTTGIAMPGRGGNPALSDDTIRAIIAFVRTETLNAGGGVAPVAQDATPEPTPAPTESSAADTSSTEAAEWAPPVPVSENFVVPERAFDPAFAYAFSCAGCHGLQGEGVANLGPALADGALFSAGDADGLVDFINTGRPLANPNVEFPHPPQGGYPTLSEENIRELVDYLLGNMR